MLDCTAMTALCLRFGDDARPDLPLNTGVHALALRDGRLVPVASDDAWVLQICHDRRGIWLVLAPGVRGIHVNGRPVRQLALLRAGDSIHAEGHELLLVAPREHPPLPPPDPIPSGSVHLVLRGIGGDHHGRSVSLEQPRWIGSASGCDLRIEGHGIVPEHARVALRSGQVVLDQTGAEVWLNGEPVRQAVLQSGDQLVFGGRHRFVLEGSPASLQTPVTVAPLPPEPPTPAPAHWTQRVPWLLVAALLLALMLSGLLMFGPR